MSSGPYSANVQIDLKLNGMSLSVAQLAPDFIILNEGVNHPPAQAELVLKVDGSERRRKLFLPQGLKDDLVRIPILPAA